MAPITLLALRSPTSAPTLSVNRRPLCGRRKEYAPRFKQSNPWRFTTVFRRILETCSTATSAREANDTRSSHLKEKLIFASERVGCRAMSRQSPRTSMCRGLRRSSDSGCSRIARVGQSNIPRRVARLRGLKSLVLSREFLGFAGRRPESPVARRSTIRRPGSDVGHVGFGERRRFPSATPYAHGPPIAPVQSLTTYSSSSYNQP